MSQLVPRPQDRPHACPEVHGILTRGPGRGVVVIDVRCQGTPGHPGDLHSCRVGEAVVAWRTGDRSADPLPEEGQ